MPDVTGPVIVRHPATKSFTKPGLHSHNITRRRTPPARSGFVRRLQILLLILGICAVSYYGYTLADQYVYQTYENWAFDQQIAGHSGVTFADYIRQQTPFGFLAGAAPAKPTVSAPASPQVASAQQPVRPAEGSVLGRVEISRLKLSAMVREGVDSKTLSTAAGHVSSTALPGQPGNFAIAAHRDTLFRALKDIRKDDLVTFQSSNGTYTYQVVATRIVRPSDVTVLRSDGGGIIPADDPTSEPTDKDHLLTMITCYPFYYVGSAPKRFIVEAELVHNVPAAPKLEAETTPPPVPAATSTNVRHAAPRHTRSSHLRHTQNAQSPHPMTQKKRPLWRRVFHIS